MVYFNQKDMNMSYTHLFLDTIAGLKKEGWKDVGGNFTSYRIMKKEGSTVKIFLKDNKKLKNDDLNYLVVRYS